MAASISPTFEPDRFESLLAPERSAVDASLSHYCDSALAESDSALSDVVRYAVLGGGKRFRGILVRSACAAVAARNGVVAAAGDLPVAVEIVHAYSLVHDDLPCMDDDDMRRGRPSTHKKFGVERATVVGFAMVPLAARAAFQAAVALELSSVEAAAIVREIVVAAGGGGMIAGQLLDLEAEGAGSNMTVADLERVHAAKTGALITASLVVGGMAARASADSLDALRAFGSHLGLAFQIADDLLDVTSSAASLGKTAGRDAALGKSTYASLLGVKEARRLAEWHSGEAVSVLRKSGLSTALLEGLATFVVQRTS